MTALDLPTGWSVAEQAIREFPFWDYGMDGVDPKSEFAEWVPDLARAVLTRVLAPDEVTAERLARAVTVLLADDEDVVVTLTSGEIRAVLAALATCAAPDPGDGTQEVGEL